MPLTDDQIARVCHEANRGYQRAVPTPGIPVAPPWDDFPEREKQGVIAGVIMARDGTSPRDLHADWCRRKNAEGWTLGPAKDPVAKTHPCLLPYDQLPADQRAKDELFRAVVDALDQA